MEFIKKMKKREFIEMGLKTAASLLAAFIAIILMECMIYGIYLNALETKGNSSLIVSDQTVVYCIKDEGDKYFVIYYNDNPDTKGIDRNEWTAKAGNYVSKDVLESGVIDGVRLKEVVYHAPSAFDFTISGVHYVVMAVFVLAIGGFFTYKFIALSNEYKKIEENYKKNGTIELG